MPYKDPEVRNARQRERYSTDPDFRLRHYEAARKWNRNARPQYAYKHRPNSPQRKVGYRKMLIDVLLERDGNHCGVCLIGFIPIDKVVIDHILAVADGGIDDGSNIQLAHRNCNAQKESDAVYQRTVNKIKAQFKED